MNHKLLNNSLLTSIAFAFSISILSCGSPKLSSYATNTNLESKAKYDFNPNKIRESGKGFSVDMKALGKLPKKIALISFYVDDPGLTKTTKSPNQSTWNTTNTGSDNARIFANQFYSKSIKTIKTTFKEFGMEVLTPNEFLKTEDQKIAYQNFVVKHTTLNKIGEGLNKFLKNSGSAHTTIETDEPADGFVLIKINKREQSDPKKKSVPAQNLSSSIDGSMIESLGYDLCNSLNVDAVLIVYNTQLCDEKWSKSRFWLSAVNMQLFGPNPLPLKEGKKDKNGYSKGLFYCGVRMPFSKGLLINPKTKTPESESLNNTNIHLAYNNMVKGCSKKIGNYLIKELK
ncbi:MAG: hypothetical protein K9I36_06480 [Bacteroidia bacterium]|nr:hypothetical protein [Bacteroidia bacterium]MCF8426358.1 hypothetical protein [Bacteroidia bacterium]